MYLAKHLIKDDGKNYKAGDEYKGKNVKTLLAHGAIEEVKPEKKAEPEEKDESEKKAEPEEKDESEKKAAPGKAKDKKLK